MIAISPKHQGDRLQRARESVARIFQGRGFHPIEPEIIQPADLFLEYSGEAIRSKTFVFSDPLGREICLRPDLTIPTCRFHLETAENLFQEARYCYCGPIFRFEGGARSSLECERHPQKDFARFQREQAGVEWFGGAEPEDSEARLLELALSALESCGISDYRVKIGDLGIFRALLEGLSIPERWRRRLRHYFWRPQAFSDFLDLLSHPPKRRQTSISPLLDVLKSDSLEEVTAFVHEYLKGQRLEMIGGRTCEEIAVRLVEKKQDRTETPLSPHDRACIDRYLAIEGNLSVVSDLFSEAEDFFPFTMAEPLAHFQRRLEGMKKLGMPTEKFVFSASFGRHFEYYTGFVFHVEISGLAGDPVVLVGGGRYDHLMSKIGASHPITALGCALDLNRISEAL